MDGREKREELAARIKAGEKSLLPMLWGECRGTVIIMAAKYRSIICLLYTSPSPRDCS